MSFDLVVRGGMIVDGDGGAPFEADVAVLDGRVAQVGKVAASGNEEIDARGRLVTPGFIDIQTGGRLRPGYAADLNVIDFDRLALARPTVVHDLPNAARRLEQTARGCSATIVGGQITYRDGAATGALPGRVLRGAA
jgi:N-acyl-D-aspartate/D-glutamate deacylase